MVNSSPEYSITKPGLPHSRKREKLLRTYGRRTSTTPEVRVEPLTKKQRLNDDKPAKYFEASTDGGAKLAEPSSESRQRATDPSTEDGLDTKRGSILSYFKPVVPKSREPRVEEPALPSNEISPSSISTLEQPRKRPPRLLKIRATMHHATETSGDESHYDTTSLEHSEEGNEDDDSICTGSDTCARSRHSSISLRESVRDQPRILEGQHASRRKKVPRPKASPIVQTTLNISAQAAFSECKVCDTVWNPLFPDDVKYHTKRHKAVLRTQKKRKMDEL